MSLSAVALPWALSAGSEGQGRDAKPIAATSNLIIEDIEIHEISPPFQEFNASWLTQYYGLDIQYRGIYILRMGNGLTGYGESWKSAPDRESFRGYIGQTLFDVLNHTNNAALNMAVHDVIGKHLGVPVWKLIGPKIRSWVPVAAWTASQPPEAMAKEVIHASQKGYRWLKYHPDVLQNVIAQTEAMQRVAPSWFRIHYDFNGYSSVESMAPVLRELEKFPIAGRLEDPIEASDYEGYRLLREKCAIPVLKHRGSTESDLLENCCNGVVIASSVRNDQKLDFLADLVNTPLLFQHVGGGITQAYMSHKAAVFPMAELDHLTGSNIWMDDVIDEQIEVVNGKIKVLDEPGLGVTVNEEKLRRYSTDRMNNQYKRLLTRVRYEGGLVLFFRHNGNTFEGNQRFMGFRHGEYHASPTLRANIPPSDLPGTLSGYANPVITEFWEDDSTEAFEQMWRRTESGSVWMEDEEAT
ncbi:MAG: enolase C-terminal domain-like protein [Balneolaceae bacterium]